MLNEGDKVVIDGTSYRIKERMSPDTFMVMNRTEQVLNERHVDWFSKEFHVAEEVMILRK